MYSVTRTVTGGTSNTWRELTPASAPSAGPAPQSAQVSGNTCTVSSGAAMLIADLTGARPSTGFVHGILRRCAHALGEVMTLVKTLVTRAAGRAAIPRGMARYSSGSAR